MCIYVRIKRGRLIYIYFFLFLYTTVEKVKFFSKKKCVFCNKKTINITRDGEYYSLFFIALHAWKIHKCWYYEAAFYCRLRFVVQWFSILRYICEPDL